MTPERNEPARDAEKVLRKFGDGLPWERGCGRDTWAAAIRAMLAFADQERTQEAALSRGGEAARLADRAIVAAEYRLHCSPHEWTDEDSAAMAAYIIALHGPATSRMNLDPTPATPPTRDGEGAVYRVLRDWRLSTMGQEDEPSAGYPLVDAVSTPGTDISTGEEELREIAQAITAAQSTPIAARADGGEVLEAIAADIDHAVAGGMSWISHGEAVEFSRRIRALAAQPANSSDREVVARIVKGARLSAAFGREFRAGDGRLDDVDLDAADAILRTVAAPDQPLLAALEGFGDDYMTSERHHPGHVLIPTEQFDRICAALAARQQADKA